MGRNQGGNGDHQRLHELRAQAQEKDEGGEGGGRSRPGRGRLAGSHLRIGGGGTCQSDRCYPNFPVPDDDPTRKMHGHDPCSRGFFPWERGRNSKFIRYYVWQKGAHSTLPARAGSDDTSLFPAALPYPEAFSAEGKAVVGHERITLFAKAFLNFWVCWSNFVVLGCPDCRNATEARVGYKQLEDVRSCADGLLGEVKEFVKDLFCVEVMQMEGGRQTLEEALQMLQMSHACYGAPVTSAKAVLEKVSAAIPVQAERVASRKKPDLWTH